MGTVYAIANQKGGVGKTTTAVNVAACIAEAGYETLLVDVDPQANATLGIGLPKDGEPSIYDVLLGDATADEAIVQTPIERLKALPAHPDLAAARSGWDGSALRRSIAVGTIASSAVASPSRTS
jgi:chromosome partitioning protein